MCPLCNHGKISAIQKKKRVNRFRFFVYIFHILQNITVIINYFVIVVVSNYLPPPEHLIHLQFLLDIAEVSPQT